VKDAQEKCPISHSRRRNIISSIAGVTDALHDETTLDVQLETLSMNPANMGHALRSQAKLAR